MGAQMCGCFGLLFSDSGLWERRVDCVYGGVI